MKIRYSPKDGHPQLVSQLSEVRYITENVVIASGAKQSSSCVIPESAKRESGIQERTFNVTTLSWVPAAAGTTSVEVAMDFLYLLLSKTRVL